MQFQGSHGYASNRFFKLTQTFKLGHRTSMTDSFWNLYIPHCKYQVIPHSSPWFSPAHDNARAHRNHIFCLYQ